MTTESSSSFSAFLALSLPFTSIYWDLLLGELEGLGTGENMFEREGMDFFVTLSFRAGGADYMALYGGDLFFLGLTGENYVLGRPLLFFKVIFVS